MHKFNVIQTLKCKIIKMLLQRNEQKKGSVKIKLLGIMKHSGYLCHRAGFKKKPKQL